MIEIKIQDNGIQAALTKLEARVSDMTPTMRKVAATMKEAIWKNFDTEGKRTGEKWKEWSEATKKEREKKKKKGSKFTEKILQFSSILYDSITEESGKDFARTGSNLDYAAIHHFGGYAGKNKKVWIPARPYFVLNDEDIEDVEDDIMDDLAKLIP